jgi:FRG domain-containing protein
MLDAYRVPPTYVFRGQADASWPLEPSLLRRMRSVTNRGYAHEIEQLLENEFMAQGALFPEVRSVWPVLLAAPRIERWAFMQHHSCPTRLLDWTASAFVAAYFAVEQFPYTDGAIFAAAPDALRQFMETQDPCKRASWMMI